MIPVLICPVLNRWDLVERMLTSVDVLVDRTVIVDNGDVVPDREDVLRPLINLGFSGAINAAISQTPEAPWWLWASNDIVFGPGDLDAIGELLPTGDPAIVTGTRNDGRLLRFAYAAVNRECIAAVGLLDEWSFFPIYYEDDDYERRCRLGGVPWLTYDGDIRHDRSTSIQEPGAAARNAETFPANGAAYIGKWGGMPGAERYDRPWGTDPLWSLRPDLAARARRLW